MAATEAIASYFCLEIVTGYNSITEQPTVELETLLELYADVFQKPSGFPPSRIQDHAIHLNFGAQPVNIKPYRYPYFQKQLIEQMVSEMLKEGVIWSSTSPFSSPVLLVRKKDGTWHFCVYY